MSVAAALSERIIHSLKAENVCTLLVSVKGRRAEEKKAAQDKTRDAVRNLPRRASLLK